MRGKRAKAIRKAVLKKDPEPTSYRRVNTGIIECTGFRHNYQQAKRDYKEGK